MFTTLRSKYEIWFHLKYTRFKKCSPAFMFSLSQYTVLVSHQYIFHIKVAVCWYCANVSSLADLPHGRWEWMSCKLDLELHCLCAAGPAGLVGPWAWATPSVLPSLGTEYTSWRRPDGSPNWGALYRTGTTTVRSWKLQQSPETFWELTFMRDHLSIQTNSVPAQCIQLTLYKGHNLSIQRGGGGGLSKGWLLYCMCRSQQKCIKFLILFWSQP